MNNILTIVNNSEHECSNICSRVCFQFLLCIFSNMGFLGPLTILCIIFLGGGLPYCFLQWPQLFLSFEARHYKKLVCECVLSCSVVSDSFRPHGPQPTRLLCPWDSPIKDTGVGCHALFQGIVSTQGLNPGLLHCRWILYHLSHQGSPRILEWVACPFPRGSSRPGHGRNQGLLNCRQILFQLSYQESQREWC